MTWLFLPWPSSISERNMRVDENALTDFLKTRKVVLLAADETDDKGTRRFDLPAGGLLLTGAAELFGGPFSAPDLVGELFPAELATGTVTLTRVELRQSGGGSGADGRASVPTTEGLEAVVGLAWKGAAWKLLPPFLELNGPEVTLTLDAQGVTGRLATRIQLGQADFAANVGFPDWRVRMAQAGGSLSLAPLLRDLDLDDLGFDLVCLRDSRVLADPRGKRLLLQGELTDVLKWEPFELHDVSVELRLAPGGHTGELRATLKVKGRSDVRIDVRGAHLSKAAGWELEGAVAFEDGATIKVSDLLSSLPLGDAVKQLPSGLLEVDLRTLSVSLETRGVIRLGLVTAKTGGELELRKREKGGYDVTFTENLKIGNALFTVKVSDGSDGRRIEASWKASDGGALSFQDVLSHLQLEIPDLLQGHLDLAITSAQLAVRELKGKGVKTFVLDGTLAGDATAFAMAVQREGKWAGAAGVVLPRDAMLKAGTVGEILGKLPLTPENIVILVSSVDEELTMPALPGFASGTFPVLRDRPIHLKPGGMVALELDLESLKSPIFSNLGTLLSGSGGLMAMVQLSEGAGNLALEVALGGKLGLFGRLELKDTAVSLTLNPPSATLSGSVDLMLDHQVVQATGGITVEETAIECTFDVKAGGKDQSKGLLTAPFGLKGVTLDELGVVMGIDLAPPAVMAGLEGKFRIGDALKGSDEFALMLELIEGEPIPPPNLLLLSVFLEKLSVESVIAAVKGAPDPGLPDFIRSITATNVWLYLCEKPVMLPDGTMAQPGFGFNGLISIHGWNAHASLMAGASLGIRGSFQADPIRLAGGVIMLEGVDTPAVTLREQKVNDQWVPIRKQTPLDPGSRSSLPPKGVEIQEREVIKRGGMRVSIDTRGAPIATAEVLLTFFELQHHLHLEINTHGLEFELDTQIGPDHTTFACRLHENRFTGSSRADLALSGGFDITILGISHRVELDTRLDLQLELDIDGEHFRLTAEGSFEHAGLTLAMPTLSIDVAFDSLKDLPAKLFDHIKDNAEEIFKEIFDRVGAWCKAAGNAISNLESDAGEEVTRIGHAAEATASKIEAGASTLAHAAESDLKDLGHNAQKALDDLKTKGEEEILKIGAASSKAITRLEGDIVHIGARCIHDLEDLEAGAEREIARLGQEVEHVKEALEHAVADLKRAVEADVEAIRKGAEEICDDIKNTAKEAARLMEEEAEAIFHALEKAAKKVRDGIEDAGEAIGGLLGL